MVATDDLGGDSSGKLTLKVTKAKSEASPVHASYCSESLATLTDQ